jgi:hypothetical protein
MRGQNKEIPGDPPFSSKHCEFSVPRPVLGMAVCFAIFLEKNKTAPVPGGPGTKHDH